MNSKYYRLICTAPSNQSHLVEDNCVKLLERKKYKVQFFHSSAVIYRTDIIKGVEFLYSNDIIHGDIIHHDTWRHQVIKYFGGWGAWWSVCFKLTDYANVPTPPQRSSHSTTMRQLMTPGCMAPELLSTGISPKVCAFAILPYDLVCGKPARCYVSSSAWVTTGVSL